MATDTFDSYSAGSDLQTQSASAWLRDTSVDTMKVTAPSSDHHVFPNISYYSGAIYHYAGSFSTDHYSEITLVVGSGSGGSYELMGPAVRCASGACYGAAYYDTGTPHIELTKWSGGTQSGGYGSNLGSYNVTLSTGAKIKLSVTGSTLTVYIDTGGGYGAAVITATDSTLTTGNPGMLGGGGTGAAIGASAWAGADVGGGLVTKLKVKVDSSAASASSVAGVVFAAPSGANITGAKIGEFTGKTFEASLESDWAVLKVPVADFGGTSLTTSDTPVALVRNTSNTSGIVSCTVIQE